MASLLLQATGRLALIFFLVTAAGWPTGAQDGYPIATGPDKVAIRGYDTVAYFTDARAVKGSADIEYLWQGTRWWFSSTDHRDLFAADPERYAPQFGGFCAEGLAVGELAPADPENWAVFDGKLYLASSAGNRAEWSKNPTRRIEHARTNWAGTKK